MGSAVDSASQPHRSDPEAAYKALQARNAALEAQLQQCQQQLQQYRQQCQQSADYADDRQHLQQTQLQPGSTETIAQTEPLVQPAVTVQFVMDNAPVMLWAADLDGHCVFLNQTWLNFVGRTLQEQLGNGWTENIHPEDVQGCLSTYHAALQTQSAFTLEYRLRRYDGVYRWILDTGVPNFLPDSSFAGFSGSGVDITDRKHTENLLRQREEQLRLTLEFTHIGSWDWDIRTGSVIWNDNHARLLGWLPGETAATYQAWRDRVHPEDLSRVEQCVMQALETQTDFESEYRIFYPDGSLHWLIGRARGIYADSGQAVRMVGMIVDITDRKQAEANLYQLNAELEQLVAQRTAELSQLVDALRVSESRYRAIVEDQTELICRFLPDGNLTFANEAYCRYFNQPLQELLDRRFLPLLLPEAQAQVTASIALLSAELPFLSHEHQVLLPTSGELRWQQWTNRAIFNDAGQIIEYQSVGRDVTDRKQAEAKLKASLDEKEVLLKEIHHRVKNNLQMISSLLSLQANTIQDPATLEPFNDSQRRIKAMALIHEKLYQSDNLAQVNFAEYVQCLANDLFRSASQSAIVRSQIDVAVGELPVDIAISCGLIINELVSNAIKHAFPLAKMGEIWIRFSVAAPDRYILTVEDNGIGIPAEHSAHPPNSLGLQIVRALTRKLRGTLEVECDGGTRFCILFSPPASVG